MQFRRILLRGLQLICVGLFLFSAWVLVFGTLPGDGIHPPALLHIATARRVAPPARLHIPRFDLDAQIVPVGLTRDGRMEVPQDAATVGWFAPGTLPGVEGSAVLTGHLDTAFGTDAVFARLKELEPGDMLEVKTQSGVALRFIVREMASYPYDDSPLQRIFAGTGGTFLNLITCDGDWVRGTYDRRTVVYTELVPG